jgi:hypothetical protein
VPSISNVSRANFDGCFERKLLPQRSKETTTFLSQGLRGTAIANARVQRQTGWDDNMTPFVYHCPTVNRKVGAMTQDDPDKIADEYQCLFCPACAQLHYVNPRSGRVQSADERKEQPDT